MRVIPNSLSKKAQIGFFAKKARELAKEMEEYFFKDNIDDLNNKAEVNVKKIFEHMKECTGFDSTLKQNDKIILTLLEHLRVISVALRQLNDDDESVKELLKSAGIN